MPSRKAGRLTSCCRRRMNVPCPWIVMFRQKNNLLGLLLLAFLAGCAHVPDMRSVRHRQAMEWEAQGERAYLRGNPEQSQRYYEAALQVNASIENARGIASDTLSLA